MNLLSQKLLVAALKRCLIFTDSFEFMTEHVIYIMVKMTPVLPNSAVHFHTSPTDHLKSNKLHIGGFTQSRV